MSKGITADREQQDEYTYISLLPEVTCNFVFSFSFGLQMILSKDKKQLAARYQHGVHMVRFLLPEK
jgi:hypothetical protein